MTDQSYIQTLRDTGLKVTPQRLSVMRIVLEKPGHFKVEDVYRRIKVTEPTITLATVYNIFKAMTEKGILKSFELDGATWFENNTEVHANLSCENCGKIEDIEIPEIGQLIQKFSMGKYKVRSASIVLKGLCSECATELGQN
jgi:Fur family peroxide stress response transcriptional regulator